jgi:NAD+ kinase
MRSALVVAHAGRARIAHLAVSVSDQLARAGFEVRMVSSDAAACNRPSSVTVVDHSYAAVGAEIVLAFGGDGTFLRAAELARPAGVPLLGVNFGHVGFLAEAEPDEIESTVAAIVAHKYEVEERVSIDAEVWLDDELLSTAWALNEASLERSSRERMLQVAVAVDGRPLLHFGCDGILCATPTGSTAYAYSAGGPIVWPNVDALIVVPNAAHALFARPIIVAPDSRVDIDLLKAGHSGVLSCDGRRSVDVPPGGRVSVQKGALPVRIVRLGHWSFADRLVAKFQLPVRSFRDERADGGDSLDGVDTPGSELLR